MSIPTVSVVLAAYNAERYIGETLDSVLAQHYKNIEIIVVDDGSTDRTVAIAEAKGEQIKVVSIQNSGPAAARNRGITEARGSYVAFIDSDDIWRPQKLEKQMAQMKRDGSKISFTDQFLIDSEGRTIRTPDSIEVDENDPLPVFFRSNFLTTSSVIVEKQTLKAVGSFNESAALRAGGEDGELWFRILETTGRLSHTRDALVGYRIHNENISGGFLSHLRARDISNGMIVQQLKGVDKLGYYLSIRTLAASYARQLSFRTAYAVLRTLPSPTIIDRLSVGAYRLMTTRSGETLLRTLHWLKHRFTS